MKLLTFVIPCYNSEKYMRTSIDSVIVGGEDVEVIIVNDGSTDNTKKIADGYAEKHPTIVKVVHQANGGHGDAVNAGLNHATGLYFKVLDSDDWVNEKAYLEILSCIKENLIHQKVDMILSNFVYEKVGAQRKKVIHYKNAFPERCAFSWGEAGRLGKKQFILMHSVIYRTLLLKKCGLKLPKHMFYVDNLFVFQPLPFVKKLYYLNVDFYRYFIGREDQSVNESNMIKRIDQQFGVNKLMVDAYVSSVICNEQLKRYMISYLDSVTMVSSMIAIRSDKKENLDKRDELFKYIKSQDEDLFHKIRYSFFGRTTHFPGRYGSKITVLLYLLGRKYIGID